MSTHALQELHQCLNRAVNRAMARDLVKRNVVALCSVPKGQPGRPSKSLTLDQARLLLDAASFRRVVEAAGLSPAEWTPRELRHSFVSPAAFGRRVSIEDIADLVGHAGTLVTEKVYRNSRELHQAGVNPQVAMSGQRLLGLSMAFGMAA
jgi:hypothetical protein